MYEIDSDYSTYMHMGKSIHVNDGLLHTVCYFLPLKSGCAVSLRPGIPKSLTTSSGHSVDQVVGSEAFIDSIIICKKKITDSCISTAMIAASRVSHMMQKVYLGNALNYTSNLAANHCKPRRM